MFKMLFINFNIYLYTSRNKMSARTFFEKQLYSNDKCNDKYNDKCNDNGITQVLLENLKFTSDNTNNKNRPFTLLVDGIGSIYNKSSSNIITFLENLGKYIGYNNIIFVFTNKPNTNKDSDSFLETDTDINYTNTNLEEQNLPFINRNNMKRRRANNKISELLTYSNCEDNKHSRDSEYSKDKIAECNLKIKKLSKKTNYITDELVAESKRILDKYGIKYIQAEHDYYYGLIKYLLDKNIADGIYSENKAMFRIGCKKIYYNLNFTTKTIVEVDLKKCLNQSKISTSKFENAFDASTNSPYTDNLLYCNFEKIINIMNEYELETIEDIVENLDNINKCKTSQIIKIPKRFNIHKTREVFSRTLSYLEIKDVKIQLSKYSII